MAKKSLSLLAAACLLLSLVAVVSFVSVTAQTVPEGYSASAPANVPLGENECYKTLTSFEGAGAKPAHVDASFSYSTLNPFTGSKSGKWTFTNGGMNAIKITEFWFTNDTAVTAAVATDWSKAKYLQFYVKNTAGTKLQMDVLDFGVGGTRAQIKEGATAYFYSTKDGNTEWAPITAVKGETGSTTLHPAYVALVVDANAEGFVRIPLNDTVFANLSAVDMTKVDNFRIWAQNIGCANPSYAFIDEMALVAETIPDNTPTGYTTTPSFQAALSSGQSVKLLEGYDAEAGGVKDIFFDGTDFTVADTHKTLGVTFTGENKNFSPAKYIQFEVENTASTPLEMFFIKLYFNAGGYSLSLVKGATGVKFYNYATSAWSDMPIADVTYYNTPGLSVAANTKGIVRIPLDSAVITGGSVDDDKYTLNGNVDKLEIYMNTPNATAQTHAKYDNFALVAEESAATTTTTETTTTTTESTTTTTQSTTTTTSTEGGTTTTTTGTPAPEFPFLAEPGVNVALQSGQTYKELNGFEAGTGVNWGAVYADKLLGEFSTAGMKNGSKAYKATFNDGGTNAIAFPKFLPENSANVDWSGAKALQFYVDNTATKNLQIEDIKFFAGSTVYKMTMDATVYFADTTANTWTQLTVGPGGNPAYHGVEIPGETKGFVRIPLTKENFGVDASELKSVEKIELFLQMLGCDKGSVVYFDDFGLVAGEDTKMEAVDDYTANNTIKLNPGETYKPLTGFEEGDKATLGQNNPGIVDITSDKKNNGQNSLFVKYSDGSAQGFQNFNINTSNLATSNWSRAKYLQFYVESTATADQQPLQLFYLQVNNGNKMLSADATGLKLYDLVTKKWSDLDVVGNSDHVYGDNKTPVPTICIPSGFKGYVRIPLTNENFMNCTLSNELKNITRIAMFSLLKGNLSEPKNVYFDDFGLVTYDGDTPPAYVDDADPDQNDDDVKYDDVVTNFDLGGTVLGLDGKPLVGATVSLNGEATCVTNSKGEYYFEGLKTDLYEISIVGADGFDYSYMTFEVRTGATTHFKNTDVRIAHDATGLTINLKAGEYGPEIVSVASGVTVPEQDTTTSTQKPTKPSNNNPSTGVAGAGKLAAAILLLAAGGCALIVRKKVDEN